MLNNTNFRGKVLAIGNDHYDQVKPDLDNAINDATGIYETFRNLGYMMMPEAYDIDIDRFDELFNDFKSDLGNYEVGVLYFSGHGIEIQGKNYLMMTNTPIGEYAESTMRYSAELQKCIKELHDTNCKMIIIIIDACRNNPFDGKERGWGSVNLAPIFAPKGTLIAYSTSPGETADDFGMEGHSVYTGALLKYLNEEGLEIETFFKKVRSTVDTMTKGKKTSWEHTSLIGSFSFNSGKMTHIKDIGYDSTVLMDAQYSTDDKLIGTIIKKLKSYNWYEQNNGVKDFRLIQHKKLDRNQLFIIGRNLLQAAVGGAYEAINIIKDGNVLQEYSSDDGNHLLNGILFEMYFNKEGQFRYKNFKISHLNEMMQFTNINQLKSSFDFIHNLLQDFSRYLIFVPGSAPSKVTINVRLVKKNIEFTIGEKEMLVVKSITFDGHELLADDEESNVFPYNSEQKIIKDDLEAMLCEGYGIPTSYVQFIYNVEPEKNAMWFDRKFRRNFRLCHK